MSTPDHPEETTMTTAVIPAAVTVTCPNCGQEVVPTREGGTRPRDHNAPDSKPCNGSRAKFRLPDCHRCGLPARSPHGCGSPMFHPESWQVMIDGVERNVGNAAAAAEIVRVSGSQYQWLVRRPPEGPRKAPAHIGIRLDGTRYYDLDAVRAYVRGRPGPGGRGPVPAAERTGRHD